MRAAGNTSGPLASRGKGWPELDDGRDWVPGPLPDELSGKWWAQCVRRPWSGRGGRTLLRYGRGAADAAGFDELLAVECGSEPCVELGPGRVEDCDLLLGRYVAGEGRLENRPSGVEIGYARSLLLGEADLLDSDGDEVVADEHDRQIAEERDQAQLDKQRRKAARTCRRRRRFGPAGDSDPRCQAPLGFQSSRPLVGKLPTLAVRQLSFPSASRRPAQTAGRF